MVRPNLATLAALAVASPLVIAEPVDSGVPSDPANRAPAHRINLRTGLASSDEVNRPTVCVEIVTWWAISAESCGTGSGILHDKVGRQLAHFRINRPVTGWSMGGGWTALRAGIGFAELEVAEDRPGFDFGVPQQPGSVAGPEGAVSLQWMTPLGGGVELVGNATVGLAWFSGADRLVLPQNDLQPFAALELGVGW